MKMDSTIQNYIDELINTYHLIINSNQQQLEPVQLLEQIITYYQDIIDCLPGNVYWFSKDCISIGANKNVLKMMGLSSIKEFEGLTFKELGRLGKWSDEATRYFEEQSLITINEGKFLLNIEEPPIPNENGELIYFLSSRVPLFDRNKNVIGFTGISFDITELKKTQQALKQAKEEAEQASKEKSEFVANMSHDIKTPLAGIVGLAEILSEQLHKEEDKHLAETLYQSGKELLNFFEDCLQNFKYTSKIASEENKLFCLSNLLNEIRALYKPTIMNKKLAFSVTQDENCPDYVRGNRAYLHRSLLNLIGNAIKFTEKGSINIHVSAHHDTKHNQHKFIFEITDTGIGILEKDQKIIFKQFTKLSPSYRGIHDGHGLGLYLVDTLVKAMHGTVEVLSQENKGSTFIIKLPLHVEAILPDPIHINYSKKENTKHRLHILIVEDHPVTQLIYQKMFASLKQKITLVENGEQALALFETRTFDMAFVDLGLPGIQGDEVCHCMREIEKRKKRKTMPIIILTAHLTQEIDVLLKQKEINAILNKPLSKDMLIELMDLLTATEN